MTVYDTLDYLRERQQEMLVRAAGERKVQRVRRLSRAARRAERAEQRLTRSWSEAARLQAELSSLTADQWR